MSHSKPHSDTDHSPDHPDPAPETASPDRDPEKAGADPGSGGEPRPEESRDEELERLRREVEQANKHALQAQADAENFRKRMRRDLDDQLRFASLNLISDLLQVRDNLFRALEAVPASHSSDAASGLREGVAMCAKQLDDVLTKHGVSEIPAADQPFDPNIHEAISQIPSDTHEAGTVVHVAQAGFRLHDRVVRPTQVVVSGGPAASAPQG